MRFSHYRFCLQNETIFSSILILNKSKRIPKVIFSVMEDEKIIYSSISVFNKTTFRLMWIFLWNYVLKDHKLRLLGWSFSWDWRTYPQKKIKNKINRVFLFEIRYIYWMFYMKNRSIKTVYLLWNICN